MKHHAHKHGHAHDPDNPVDRDRAHQATTHTLGPEREHGADHHSCCHHSSSHGHAGHEHDVKPSAVAKYFCPMCPGVESDKPGDCPKCGMTLERNPAYR